MEAEAAQRYARTGGWLYALLFVAGSSLFIQSGSIISGNAAATAHNIEASSQLWRIALAAEIVMYALDVPLAVIFYVLMRPVNNGLALASSAFRFAEAVLGCTIALLNAVPLYVLNGSAYLKAIGRPQLDALAYVSLKAHGDGAVIALLLFGIHCVLLGYLVFRRAIYRRCSAFSSSSPAFAMQHTARRSSSRRRSMTGSTRGFFCQGFPQKSASASG